MSKLTKGVAELVSPKNSEFWVGLAGVAGWVAQTAGWVGHDTWEKWGPGLVTYVAARFVSKTAKG